MTTSDPMATALLTEHFGYTPLTLLDDIINTVNELVFQAVTAVNDGISMASAEKLGFTLPDPSAYEGSDEETRRAALEDAKMTEIAAGVVKLETLLMATVDKDFDKFEIYTLRNILAVGHAEEHLAPWVRLEHYRDIGDFSFATTPDGQRSDRPTPEQIQLARRKFRETAKLNGMLKAEEARNAAVLAQLHALLGDGGGGDGVNNTGNEDRTSETNPPRTNAPLSFLSSANPNHPQQQHQQQAPTTLTDDVQYALSHLPAIRTLLAQLKNTLSTLPRSSSNNNSQGETMDERRRRYVESRTRRALERRGMETEDSAAMSLAATGRSVRRDEIDGMEAVVRALNGDSSSSHIPEDQRGQHREATNNKSRPDDVEMSS